MDKNIHIEVADLTMAYDDNVIQRNLTFQVRRGDIFILMGDSGCGKSTLLRYMTGLKEPETGRILIGEEDFWRASQEQRDRIMRRSGILYQHGALWSSMTVAENVGLPLSQFTDLSLAEVEEMVTFKLSLVGLSGFEDYYPSELSGGMQKRAGLARAIALDPQILFFDEPSTGLDPVNAKRLDDLILELRDSLGATLVIVTHEVDSIVALGNDSIFLDTESKTMIASGDPKLLLKECDHPKVRRFFAKEAEIS